LQRLPVGAHHDILAHGDAVPSNPDGTTFGPTDALFGVSEREYRVVNTGLSNLVLTGSAPVSILDDPGRSFQVVQQPAGVVAPGGSAVFRVRFTPGNTGLLSARVQVRSSDPQTPAYVFAIQGRGVAVPRVVISGAGQDIARDDASPSMVDRTDFGRRMANVNDRLRLFTITNLGLGTLTFNRLSGVRITGTNAADFTIVTPPARGAIGYLESVTILVRFAPVGVGTRGAELSLVSNDPLGTYRFAIGGLAI
ncbi:MAG: choice-of-anchor D domain-containing protein, partial [Phycisphaerales bacterium]|nr:choice-of-anchor D domain-containing protein [Phycisphaerales bacterium]